VQNRFFLNGSDVSTSLFVSELLNFVTYANHSSFVAEVKKYFIADVLAGFFIHLRCST